MLYDDILRRKNMTHHRHYKHLHVPETWEQYWSKYPNGYSIMEALIDWVSQTNKMIESFNDLSDEYTTLNRNMRALEKELRASWKGYKEHTEKTYTDFREEILTIVNQWIATIEPTIQDEVVNSLSQWLDDGTLANIINEDIFNMKADKTALDETNAQMDVLEQETSQRLSDFDAQMKKYHASEYGTNGSAINQAIGQAETDGGGVVVIDGVFNVNDENIIIKPHVHLVGEPTNRIQLTDTMLYTDGVGGDFYSHIQGLHVEQYETTTNNSPIVIEGVTDGDKASHLIIQDNVIDCHALGGNGIRIDNGEHINIERNTVNDSGSNNGIILVNSQHIDVRANNVYRSGRAGIQVYSNCNNIRIHDNYVYGYMLRREVNDGGIDSYGPYNYNISVYDNTVDTGTTGAMSGIRNHILIRMQGVHGVFVKNNILIAQSPTVSQIMRISHRADEEVSEQGVLEGNVVYLKENTDYVWRFDTVKDVTIRNNKIYAQGGVCNAHVLEVRGNLDRLTMVGNAFYGDMGQKLVSVYGSGVRLGYLSIKNTIFTSQSGSLLNLNNLDYQIEKVLIQNNEIETTNTTGIYIYSSINKLMITGNSIQCGTGGTPISKKDTLGEGNEIIANNFELVGS